MLNRVAKKITNPNRLTTTSVKSAIEWGLNWDKFNQHHFAFIMST